MSKYNFFEEVDRKNTFSLKWDIKRGRPSEALPFWVADMDFKLPDEILSDMNEFVSKGVFGYSEPTTLYFDALEDWYKRRYSASIDRDLITLTPGVVFSLCTLIRILTNPRDSVIILSPVYYPFKESVVDNNRTIVESNLVFNGIRYEIDFVDFENKIIENDVKLFILCNPHNPVGRVWTINELEKLNEICKKHNVFIISDEIHQDFVFEDNKFHTMLNICDKNFCVVSSASKSFNIPGLQLGYTIFNDIFLKQKFKKELDKIGYSQVSLLGLVASCSAYNKGEAWLKEVKDYIWDNVLFVIDYFKKNMPEVKVLRPEGTYLVWLDFNLVTKDYKKISDIILNKALVWLDDGYIFGSSGEGFERINVATRRDYLELALKRIVEAFKELKF